MEKIKSLKVNQAGAILFAFILAIGILSFLPNITYYGLFSFILETLRLSALGIIAFSLFKERRDDVHVIGFLILASVFVLSFLGGFFDGQYMVETYSWRDYEKEFSIWTLLPSLANVAGYVLSALVAASLLTDKLPQFKELAKKYYFVPSACIVGSYVVALIVWLGFGIGIFDGWWNYSYVHLSIGSLFGKLIIGAAMYLGFSWIVNPELTMENILSVKTDAEGNIIYDIPVEDVAYKSLFKHVVLLLITFGIYNLIWVYRTTAYLNRVEDEPKQVPVYKLLLYMFVPFYSIYWTYKNSLRLEKYAQSKGVECEISLLCLITSFTIIPVIIMQDKINETIVGKKVYEIDETQPALSPKASDGLVKHMILLLVTCGIWQLIWIYRTTRELNIVKGEVTRNPVNKLLLCLFVPFYIVYWYYVSAQRIDKLANSKGVKSDLATWTLILSLVMPIVPAILMQDKMNKLV